SHGGGEGPELGGVGQLGGGSDGGGGPAEVVVVLDGQADFFGAGLEVLVVVAALAGGVLEAACVGQGVGCFVQEGGEDLACGAAQSFAADHDLGELLACDVPPAGGVVAPAGVLAVGAAGDDDHDGGDFGVPAADLQP